MDDLISRKALLNDYFSKWDGHVTSLPTLIKSQPSAQKKGKWLAKAIVESEDGHIDAWQSAKCSVCERYHTTPYLYFFTDYNFCPHCGADMRGEDDG